ncbi:glycosyl transferases group 1 family protein [Paraburkholderia xenovorans LB400]|uniref:Lipopolysaccharide biosynthesis glycosyltransferase protein n=1 Tax=Paraburkholderia xenovorans (strain LB400) TaxID=266265 RepID=Q142P2_PARXL|nr:Putative lipopolysaccharide biosynthesis glycosyltransferase protein [Paraburkholderia xenovorans LB400]AIP32552.1 glycosyl transferases group 1 family protein [Paraburkholderia xenovorans LB400]
MSTVTNATPPPPRAARAPLRILFHINDFGKGGTETALLAWLKTLDRRCFAPSLSVAYPTDDLTFWRAQSIPDDVPVHVLAASKWMYALHQAARRRKLGTGAKLWHKLLTYGAIRPLAALRLRRLAKQHDLICDFDFSLRHVAGSGNVPWFGVSHFSLAARLGGKSERYVARRVRHYSRYSAIAVLTPAMLREAQALFSAGGPDIVELPNVIDVDALRRAARAPIERPAESFIVSVARLDEGQKDHKTLLRAYAQVRERGRCKAALVLIGEGRDRRELEQLADELGIGAAVHFLGFCANPSPYIRQAELLVLSSRYEGFGMVLGEAMALGTPVLSADCPTGPRDLLEDGKAGLLVPVGDVDAMARAIERLLTDTELRRSLVQAALQKIETFTPARANQRMLELAANISAKHGLPAAQMPR